jgi:hypothetical protein
MNHKENNCNKIFQYKILILVAYLPKIHTIKYKINFPSNENEVCIIYSINKSTLTTKTMAGREDSMFWPLLKDSCLTFNLSNGFGIKPGANSLKEIKLYVSLIWKCITSVFVVLFRFLSIFDKNLAPLKVNLK